MLTEVEVADSIDEMGVSDFVDCLDSWGDDDGTADLSVGEAVLKDAKFGCEGGGEDYVKVHLANASKLVLLENGIKND